MRAASAVLALSLLACSDDAAAPAATVAFELDAPLAGDTFWDLPFPSDLRLTADGRPDLEGFPNPRNLPVIEDLLAGARERRGFPTMPIAWFRFTGAPPARALGEVIPASPDAPALLVDIDPTSDERGALYPLVSQTLPDDGFTGSAGVVAVAPRPGIVLRPGTRYAVILTRAFAPDTAVPPAFADLAAGRAASAAATALYAPLWDALPDLGLTVDDLLVATVFTTGDEQQLLRERSEQVRAAADATIQDVRVDPTDGAAHPDVCELLATVTLPQFQRGSAPFNTEGTFALDGAGAPIAQGTLTVPLVITLPKGTMPAGGWPLWQYFHGSGGSSFDLVDEGWTEVADGPTKVGEGPGVVVGRRGIAAAASALPVNPERLVNASPFAYLNLNNLHAFPYTFQQGVFEQRLLLDALLDLEIPAATVAACTGLALPEGATAHRFDADKLVGGGHSMGGMYTNMIGAVEPRYGALTPFGAGGFWSMMILDTDIVMGSRGLLAGILGVEEEPLSFLHPTMALIGLGWEIAEPGAAMARIARRPLPGMAPRPVYQPVGLDDRYFPNPVFDAAALAYGNTQAGEIVWPETQQALALDGLDGLLTYPITNNRTNADGSQTTAVVVQYRDGGLVDAHQIYRQLPEVRYQYGCFLASFLRDGVPTVYAPKPEASACE